MNTNDELQQHIRAIGRAAEQRLLAIDPHDLIPALINASEPDKRKTLAFYAAHDSFPHVHIIKLMLNL